MSLLSDHQVHRADASSSAPGRTEDRFRKLFRGMSSLDWLLLAILALIALLPRLYFALTLDVSTDEPIYTIAGKGYILAIKAHSIHSGYWTYNNEHPAFAKLLMGFSVAFFQKVIHSNEQLFAARVPSVIMGTMLILAAYVAGRAIMGRTLALLAALCLAVSPYAVYYNAQALLDTTMVTFISAAFLFLWFAVRQPRLYLVVGGLVGVALASKYPSALSIGGMLLFVAYYYFVLRFSIPEERRPALPWGWWVGAVVIACLAFFLADPALWADPVQRLTKSLAFSLSHSDEGHISFWAGQVYKHVPGWIILYVLWVKVSAFITIPALFFLVYALFKLCQFHFSRKKPLALPAEEQLARIQQIRVVAFLFSWLACSLLLYSQLNILVGAHYYLPVLPPLVFSGVYGLAVALRYRPRRQVQPGSQSDLRGSERKLLERRTVVTVGLLALLVVGPHLLGLLTVYKIEGYTSELVRGENNSAQVAYDGYSDASDWLVAHAKKPGKVGIVGGPATVLWYISNPHTKGGLEFIVTEYGSPRSDYDYLVWPMHLEQRHFSPPPEWRSKIVHIIQGGETTYCFIMARDPSSVTL